MKILYIHQYFKVPGEPGGTRSYWVAKEMISAGHEVIMITSKNNQNTARIEKNIDGIKVIYLNVKYSQKMNFTQRLTSFIRFSFFSLIECIKQRKDTSLIYATSTPLTVAIPALVFKAFLNIPYIFEVRDLWPEVPIQMGAIKNKQLIKSLVYFETLIYKKAKTIITLSPGMQDGVFSRGIKKSKVHMIPNMSKIDKFYPRKKSKLIINEFGIKNNQLNIIYFGSVGISNGLSKVVEFFGKTKQNVRLFIAGNGSELDKINEVILSNNYKRVRIIGEYGMEKISEVVNCCDICLVSFLNIPVLDTNSPNKLFDSLSAGKPILLNSKGWTKEMINKYKCGFYYDYDSFDSFEKAISKIISDKSRVKLYGENSRKLATEKFEKSILAKKICLTLNKTTE